jgi:hypothetical protein
MAPNLAIAQKAGPDPARLWTQVVSSGQQAVLQSSRASAFQPSALQIRPSQTEAEPPGPAAAPSAVGGSSAKRAILIAIVAAVGTVAIYAALENKTLR